MACLCTRHNTITGFGGRCLELLLFQELSFLRRRSAPERDSAITSIYVIACVLVQRFFFSALFASEVGSFLPVPLSPLHTGFRQNCTQGLLHHAAMDFGCDFERVGGCGYDFVSSQRLPTHNQLVEV